MYKYSPVKNTWQKVDAISPVGLTGHTGVKLNETMVLITGGVNEHIFDKYFIDIAAADESEKNKVIYNYFNKPAKDYFLIKSYLSTMLKRTHGRMPVSCQARGRQDRHR